MDIHKALTHIERLHRMTSVAGWIKGAADAAGLDKVRRVAGALSAVDCGEVLLARLTNNWQSYHSEILADMAHNVRDYAITAHYHVYCGTVGTYPVWWYSGDRSRVYAPAPEHEVVASIIATMERARVSCRPGGKVSMSIDPDDRPLPGAEIPAVFKLAADLRATMPFGTRCAILYGPPGSGKSIAVRQVARKLGGSWLAIAPEHHGSAVAWNLARALAPEVLILDDVDSRELRSGDDSAMILSQIEAAREYARVILITANTLDDLRGAILRPGRVDEDPILVAAPTRAVITEIVDGVSPSPHMKTLAPIRTPYHTLPPDVARRVIDCAYSAGLLPAYVSELRIRAQAGRPIEAECERLALRMAQVGDR
jgi:hypothetical protein